MKYSRWYRKYRVWHFYKSFHIEVWRIWFPFWVKISFSEYYQTPEEAKEFLDLHVKLKEPL